MKILVVEDHRRLAQNIVEILKQKNFKAEAAYDGVTAIEKIKNNNWNLLLLDWNLPGKNGLEILKDVRAAGIAVPVIFLTARGEVDEKVAALELGADDYLVKPFDFTELVARINTVLRRQNQVSTAILQIDNLALDTNGKIAKRNNKNILLSSTEYRLLEFLMTNPGHIKNETQILDHVWDYSDDSNSNKVAVYMSYLRTKIDKNFPEQVPLIHTIRGIGYKIDNQS